MAAVMATVAIGLVSGFTSGLAGIGGGVVIVPALVLLLGEPQHLAQGTALAVIVPSALMGTLTHLRNGYVLLKGALVLAAGGVLGAQLGSRLALSMEAGTLTRLFGLFLLASGLRMAYGSWRARPGRVTAQRGGEG
ncbi:MAG: sulfite exporter TauE/SafE family protein [Acidimicrobiia bacterium]